MSVMVIGGGMVVEGSGEGDIASDVNGEWLCSRGGGEVEQLWRQKGWWRDGEKMSIIAERW